MIDLTEQERIFSFSVRVCKYVLHKDIIYIYIHTFKGFHLKT